MRSLSWCLALAALTTAAPASGSAQAQAKSAGAADQQPAAQRSDRKLRQEISRLGATVGFDVPPADSFALGGRTVAAGSTVNGTLAAANGPVDVSGRVIGNVVVLHGDVVVHSGGSISGDAVAVDGRVRLEGGNVFGEMRSLSGLGAGTATAVPAAAPISTWQAVKLVCGWFVMLVIIGIGVLLFAERNLNGVVTVLERHPARAFFVGLLAELGLVPVLVVGVVALAITLIGILLIPFAIVAYIIAAAGLFALGFLAVARFTGRALFRADPDASPRSVTLRALLTGLVLYLGIWFVVAALTWMPAAQPVLRAVAVAVTWVALTTGLGATVLSRAGTQHEQAQAAALGVKRGELMDWQTPTPVTGVSAARRPVPGTREGR